RPMQLHAPNFLKYAAGAFTVASMLVVFVPFMPDLPGTLPIGVDSSWRFAVNEAVAQKLVFGKDIVFTYGPYASVFTKFYHPATAWLMLGGSIFLGLCYAFMLIILARILDRQYILLIYIALCAALMFSHEEIRDAPHDALFYSYPLLLALL